MFTLQEGHEMKQKNKRTKKKKEVFTEVIVRKWTTDELMELGRS